MSEYHDTQYRSKYVTVHGASPCVLPTMLSSFHMDKADNKWGKFVINFVQIVSIQIQIILFLVSNQNLDKFQVKIIFMSNLVKIQIQTKVEPSIQI
jgi:hypothetical protein